MLEKVEKKEFLEPTLSNKGFNNIELTIICCHV
jgi:hypothetical protein